SDAAKYMTKNEMSALLINIDENTTAGIVTDHDIRARVVAANEIVSEPVYKIMSSPLITITENSLVFEAILKMQEKRVRHLAVKDVGGNITSVVSFEELMQAQTYSLSIIIHEIEHAESVAEIIEVHDKMPQLINTLINSGANTQNITRIITSVTDTISRKLIEFAINDLGQPPGKFAFIVLGSEGREEQTLATDQDNAIIFEETDNEVDKDYYIKLGEKVCNWLNDVGYKFCEGNIMAKNPKWCQPFSVWKEYFSNWILLPESKNLLNINIFFDYRMVYGHSGFVEDLTKFIYREVEKTDQFYYHFAGNALQFKSPLDFFGNIRTTNTAQKEGVFSIKESIVPLVSFARIYALKNGVIETNTLARMKQLVNGEFIREEMYDEFVVAYNYLMLMRFTHQIELIQQGKTADNFIVLKKQTGIEQTMLKKVFNQIADFQKNIAMNFTGKTI
ncbi:MAG: CBS domain-containing protein, partial [Bacteroidales bacterium]|nr:CBS domain-containing protein [Bacteroidales bacterium]